MKGDKRILEVKLEKIKTKPTEFFKLLNLSYIIRAKTRRMLKLKLMLESKMIKQLLTRNYLIIFPQLLEWIQAKDPEEQKFKHHPTIVA